MGVVEGTEERVGSEVAQVLLVQFAQRARQ